MTTSRKRAPAKAPAPGPVVRSLADDLRARSDDELAALLAERPDLTHPVPSDLGALAVRGALGVSVARALDRLDRFGLDVVDALCVLPDPTTASDVAALVGADQQSVDLLLERLRLMALWWGSSLEDVHLVRVVRDVAGPHPARLGPAGRDDVDVTGLLAEAPDQALEVLRRLDASGPVGQVAGADRIVTVDDAKTPIEWLLARRLLLPLDSGSVVLPREVGLALRGGTLHAEPRQHAPELAGIARDAGRVEGTAAQAAFAFVRAVEALLEAWSLEPPTVLRAGGVSVRDMKTTTELLDLDEAQATLVVETAFAAGLLADSAEFEPTWVPTQAYDVWLTHEIAQRWVLLAQSWLLSPRVVGLAGSKDDKGTRLAPLAAELERSFTVEVRTSALEEAATLEAGTAVVPQDVADIIGWRRPRRASRLRDQLVGWTFDEAEQLGVTGLHALPDFARALLTGDTEIATSVLAKAMPSPVDKVVLQADLTAVAPGPLESVLAREIALLADVESTGGATVYRFSESSVRRALDAGRDAADIRALLERSSLTPVPQPLEYLVEDVARRHGAIRVGAASSYLRCDDESVIAELLADRRAVALRLRRLAPTVVASGSAVDALLDRLRDLGYSPVAESAEGTVVIRRPDAKRAPAHRRGPRAVVEPSTPGEAMLSAAVRAMRAGERAAATGAGSRGPGSAVDTDSTRTTVRPPVVLATRSSADTLAVLKDATEAGRTVWIGYSDNHGSTTERVVDPVRVSGGFLTAFDHRSGEVRTFAVHRVTGVADAEPAEPAGESA